MADNPLLKLAELGQSVWIDYIRRGILTSGELKRLIIEDGLRGMTSNPTIFEKAINGSDDYTDELKKLVAGGRISEEIYDIIVLEDIGNAADLLRPVYDRTKGCDGFVSIEVPPDLAFDTKASVKEAHRLFDRLNRPNIMVKIPGTNEGLPAIEQCLAEGININITLLFDIANYEAVMEAYLSALETRVKRGEPVDKIASVASFFVSRIDTEADKLITEKMSKASYPQQKENLKSLLGKTAVANAKLAYQRFKRFFEGGRYVKLKSQGVKVQRPLWASTSTKNPKYSDILYVQELIAKDSVNTMPLETLQAFKDHGTARLTIEENLDDAHTHLSKLSTAGIDLNQITQKLQADGVQLFIDSFQKLMASIRTRREAIQSGTRA